MVRRCEIESDRGDRRLASSERIGGEGVVLANTGRELMRAGVVRCRGRTEGDLTKRIYVKDSYQFPSPKASNNKKLTLHFAIQAFVPQVRVSRAERRV